MQIEKEPQYQEVQNQSEFQQQVQAPPPQAEPAAESWAENNDGFGQDEIMTLAAYTITHKLIEEEGFDPAEQTTK